MSLEPRVRQNVDAFVDLFYRIRKESTRSTIRFRTWVDSDTGQLRFEEEGKKSPRLQDKRWKPLQWNGSYEKGHVFFDSQTLVFPELSPDALRVFKESLDAIRAWEEQELNQTVSDQQLLDKVWYEIDRLQAETLLLTHPVGTYLFRKDREAELLEAQYPRAIKCYTLSLLMPRRKCCEYLIVCVEGHWQIYNDDLSLSQPSFPSLLALLQSMPHLCRYPLYH